MRNSGQILWDAKAKKRQERGEENQRELWPSAKTKGDPERIYRKKRRLRMAKKKKGKGSPARWHLSPEGRSPSRREGDSETTQGKEGRGRGKRLRIDNRIPQKGEGSLPIHRGVRAKVETLRSGTTVGGEN